MASPSNQKLSTEQQQSIASLLSTGHSKRSVAKALGVSDSTVRKYAERLGTNIICAAQDPKDPDIMMGREIARLKAKNDALSKRVKKVEARGFGYDDFLEGLQAFVAKEKLQPLVYYPTQIAKAKKLRPIPAIDPKHSEIMALALSDWHVTEVVRLEDSNGINVYNSLIAANRLWSVVQTFKQIFQIHRAAYPIKKIWLPTVGDMLSGSIHPEFLTTNDLTDQGAILLVARLYEMLLLELKSLDVPIEIDAVCGNHPRTTAKVPTKQLARTNLDWVVYMFVQMLFRNDPQIKFRVHTSQLALVEQFGHRYVIEHGIEWKNNREEDFESSIRDILDDPIYRDATGLQGASFDHVVIGQLHKGKFLERTIVNGSLIGQNELGQQWRLKPIKAQQLTWGISRSHVRTFGYPLDVTRIRSEKIENPFSEFTFQFLRDHGRYNSSFQGV